jgi:predicted amidophosphoribosyltransferase
VPLPRPASRARTRWNDQAVVLARALGRRTTAPVAEPLRRRGARTRQLGAGRVERLQTGRLDFACPGGAPARVVLVDDVHTTGATLRAAASALRDAGADQVDAVTWARTL